MYLDSTCKASHSWTLDVMPWLPWSANWITWKIIQHILWEVFPTLLILQKVTDKRSVIIDSYPAVCCFVLSKSLQSLWISLTRERASKNVCKKTNSNTYSTCTITYKTEHVDSILLCICSVVIDHRWCKNVVRTRKWLTSPAKCVTDVCILWPAIDYTNYTKWRCCRPQKWVHSLFLSELEPHPVLIGILKWMHLRLFLSSVFSDWEIKRAK